MDTNDTSVGRPTVMTGDVMSKLKAILQRGISIKKACDYAGIGEKTFYRHLHSDSEFRQFVLDCRNYATLIAGEVVVKDIVENKNVKTSMWWLERKDPQEFSKLPSLQNAEQNISYEFISDADFYLQSIRHGIKSINPALLVSRLASSKS